MTEYSSYTWLMQSIRSECLCTGAEHIHWKSTLLQCLVFCCFFFVYSKNTNSAAPSMFSMCSHVCFSLNMRLWQGLISLRWLYTAAHFLHACPATGACTPPVDRGTDGELCPSTAHLWDFWVWHARLCVWAPSVKMCLYTVLKMQYDWFKIFITVDWFCFSPVFLWRCYQSNARNAPKFVYIFLII